MIRKHPPAPILYYSHCEHYEARRSAAKKPRRRGSFRVRWRDESGCRGVSADGLIYYRHYGRCVSASTGLCFLVCLLAGFLSHTHLATDFNRFANVVAQLKVIPTGAFQEGWARLPAWNLTKINLKGRHNISIWRSHRGLILKKEIHWKEQFGKPVLPAGRVLCSPRAFFVFWRFIWSVC